jgi:glucokinase
MLLAGDIGGTKTDLAVFSPDQDLASPLAQKRFASADYPDLESMVQQFLSEVKLPVEKACFGVAGPVSQGTARLTNLPWTLEEASLKQALKLKSVRLVNDLLTIAAAIPYLPTDWYYTLNKGKPITGAIAVIAPGTGLGEAFLTWDGSRYYPHPSEGGHSDFAPGDRIQVELAHYLWEHFPHVSYERVCSGKGLPNIYSFLKERGYAPESAALAGKLAQTREPARLIINSALDPVQPDELCRLTLDTFVAILGAEAGNFALTVMAQNGVYLAGGIPKSILPVLKEGGFMDAFRHKGRFSDLLSEVPVHVILQRAELLGAAIFARDIL